MSLLASDLLVDLSLILILASGSQGDSNTTDVFCFYINLGGGFYNNMKYGLILRRSELERWCPQTHLCRARLRRDRTVCFHLPSPVSHRRCSGLLENIREKSICHQWPWQKRICLSHKWHLGHGEIQRQNQYHWKQGQRELFPHDPRRGPQWNKALPESGCQRPAVQFLEQVCLRYSSA